MRVVPISLREANAYVADHHRHSKPTRGHKFSVAIADGEQIMGVAIAGRPVSRMLDDGHTLEVLRVCTTGVANGCSMLYAACRVAARGMGYDRVVTYTLASETGASVRAAGFVRDGNSRGGEWGRKGRERESANTGPKVRWIARLGGDGQ